MRWLLPAVVVGMLFPSCLVAQPEVRLEAHDGKTHFRLGDPIRLDLVFVDPSKPFEEPAKGHAYLPSVGQMTVNATDYGDIADKLNISPAAGWSQWQGASGHDYSMSSPVSDHPVTVPITVNEGYVFQEPGHYEITVTTRRMGGKEITTNGVDIDIDPFPADEEAAYVKSLVAELAGSKGKQQQRALEALGYLTGDDAMREKVKLIVAPVKEDHECACAGIRNFNMTNGLAWSRNKDLQVKLLRDALADPAVRGGQLLYELAIAERLALGGKLPGFVMFAGTSPRTATDDALTKEHAEDVATLLAVLPRRTGTERRDALYDLMQMRDLSAAQKAALKPALLEEFASMDGMSKDMLLAQRWDEIHDPSLEPAIVAMLAHPVQYADVSTELQRLGELDVEAAKPYLIARICSPERGLQMDKLTTFRSIDRLPEVKECLAGLLSKPPARPNSFDWSSKAELAARFAPPEILQDVRSGATSPEQEGPLFAVLLRDDVTTAMALLGTPDSDRRFNIFFQANRVYDSLGKPFPPELLTWLRAQLALDDDRSLDFAANELAAHGEASDRQRLEQRLTQYRQAHTVQAPLPANQFWNGETQLIAAMRNAKTWSESPDRVEAMYAGCVTDICRKQAADYAKFEHMAQ